MPALRSPGSPAAPGTALRFVAREPPLAPVAAWARGAAGQALLRALLARGDEALAPLRGVHAGEVVIVTGPADALPWVDGVAYLGRDEEAPSLLLPTTLRPVVATELVERALRSRAPGASPLALLVESVGVDGSATLSLVSLAGALPVSRAVVAGLLGAPPSDTAQGPG